MKYYIKEYETLFGLTKAIIAVCEDGKTLGIPNDEANSDYQAYLAWLTNGNTPEKWED